MIKAHNNASDYSSGFCAALASNALAAEAGLPSAALFSVYPTDAGPSCNGSDWGTRRRRASASASSASSARGAPRALSVQSTSAACMLAPCVHHRWAGNCNITCVCSNYGNGTSDACVISGASSEVAPTWGDKALTLDMIRNVNESLNQIVALDRDASPSSGACTTCEGICPGYGFY